MKIHQDSTSSPRPILLAEDDANDVVLMKLAFERAGVKNPVYRVQDGSEALEYLDKSCGDREGMPQAVPQLLLLDLKMPRLDGFFVLEWLQQRPDLNRMAKVVLTSSNLEADILRARKLGANDYLVKPNSFAGLVQLVATLHARWLSDSRE